MSELDRETDVQWINCFVSFGLSWKFGDRGNARQNFGFDPHFRNRSFVYENLERVMCGVQVSIA